MKVSIITLHGANNVGAYLQAFSLQEVVKGLVGENNCSFLRFSSRVAQHDSKLKKAVCYLKQRKIRQVFFKYRTAKKYQLVYDRLSVEEQPFSVDNKYDTVIIGSDEVWNVASQTFVHHEQYFAKNLKADNIISYAPSAGNCDAKAIHQAGMDFSAFHHLSARDENACDLIQTIDGRQPKMVCDPTLLLESFDPYLEGIGKPNRDNYILVYSYGLGRDKVSEIKKYARQHGKRLISVGTYNSWCDENVVVDPLEFLRWLQFADIVITSTFHGTVLSAKLHKRLAVYAGSNEKVLCFLKDMELESRNVSAGKNLAGILADKIDYERVERKLLDIRKASMDYLKGALENNGD